MFVGEFFDVLLNLCTCIHFGKANTSIWAVLYSSVCSIGTLQTFYFFSLETLVK